MTEIHITAESLGQVTDDIVYSFTIAQNSLVTINNCNSAIVDTYVRLYNSNRTLIQLNDDNGYNGTICSNSLNSSIRINLIPGTYFVASEGYSNSYVGNIITSIAVAAYDATYGAATGRQEAIEDVISHNKAAVEDIQAYPNPVKDGTVYFGRTVENYSLINSAGAPVLQGTHTDKVNVEHITPGLYLLKMDQKTERIVVQ
ncbi:MAG TPA: DVUA0089 family protein [Cytophagales bacterium]|nr:DVUA0089 family protein [Cytophagales bacterium]